LKILFINQAFHPDPVATAYYVADAASDLVRQGHFVTVLTSRRGYAEPHMLYHAQEIYHGVQIIRCWPFSLGRKYKLFRLFDALCINACFFMRACMLSKQDIIVALTSPPLVAFFASLAARFKKSALVYWIMDINPDEAIAVGWIKTGSWAAKFFTAIQRSVVQHSSRIIVLDRFMTARVLKFQPRSKVSVIPPWGHGHSEYSAISRDSNEFIKQYSLQEKFVVMYAGNHSVCHPLDTVLEAARALSHLEEVVFVFVGGGVRIQDVKNYKMTHQLKNIIQVPYIARDRLIHPLSAADLHLVVMGDNMAGIVHPCKIYGILESGKPFVYIGPSESHIGELLKAGVDGHINKHGDVQGLVEIIKHVQKMTQRDLHETSLKNKEFAKRFSGDAVIPHLTEEIISAEFGKPNQ